MFEPRFGPSVSDSSQAIGLKVLVHRMRLSQNPSRRTQHAVSTSGCPPGQQGVVFRGEETAATDPDQPGITHLRKAHQAILTPLQAISSRLGRA